MPRRNKGPHLKWRQERNCWEIRWFEQGDKRSKTTGTDERSKAEEKLATFILGTEPVNQCDPAARFIVDVLNDYCVEKAPSSADPVRTAYAVEALIGFWQGLTVSEISEKSCREYCTFRKVSNGTTRRELATLGAALTYDFKQGRLTVRPHVWMPPQPESKDRWLTRHEIAALLRTARNSKQARFHMPLFILIGLYTGARKEAILSLRWPQVDLERGLIDFNQPGRARTNKGRPIIPIPRRLMTFLRLAKKRGTETGHLFSILRRVTDSNGQRRVIHHPIKDIKKGFHATACKAGFTTKWQPSKKTGPAKGGLPVTWVHPVTDVTPHVLRHTAASWMVQAGVSFAKVARYIGHKNSRTTENIYAHHAPDYLADAKNAFD